MFVILRVEVVVDRALPAVRQRVLAYLRDESETGAATHAGDDQVAVYRRAGVAGVTKKIEIQTLRPVDTDYRSIIPLRWTASGHGAGLFPTLDANVELHAVDNESTKIAVIGSYVPPLGRTGKYLDRMVLREVAHATLRRFVDRMAELAAADPAGAPVGS